MEYQLHVPINIDAPLASHTGFIPFISGKRARSPGQDCSDNCCHLVKSSPLLPAPSLHGVSRQSHDALCSSQEFVGFLWDFCRVFVGFGAFLHPAAGQPCSLDLLQEDGDSAGQGMLRWKGLLTTEAPPQPLLLGTHNPHTSLEEVTKPSLT